MQTHLKNKKASVLLYKLYLSLMLKVTSDALLSLVSILEQRKDNL